MNIGRRLYELRVAKGLSQGDIEMQSGLRRAYISRVENEFTIPNLETLERFSGALEIELYQLFFEGEGKPKSTPFSKQAEMNREERKLVDAFRKLSKRGKKLVVGMTRQIANDGG